MNTVAFLEILAMAEKLKCNTRHSWTSNGCHEIVADKIEFSPYLKELKKEIDQRISDKIKEKNEA
ncbi:MAG: hypothetical protein ACRC92_24875 [Peptostreptococcaceae bacterium]